MQLIKFKLFTFLILTIILPLFSQNTFVNNYDEGYSEGKAIIRSLDGNYLVGGRSCFSGYSDNAYIMKVDTSGNLVWNYSYGGNNKLVMSSITQVYDSTIVLAGYDFTKQKTSILKIDSEGDSLWNKTFNFGTGTSKIKIIESMDSSLIITGTTKAEELFLLKLNMNGDSLWCRKYSNGDTDYGVDIMTTNDLSYIILGNTSINSNKAISLIKTDFNGNEIWNKTYYHDYGSAYSIVQTHNNNYFIAASDLSSTDIAPYFQNDIWLMYIDEFGDTLWTKAIDRLKEVSSDCIETSDNKLIVVGSIWGGDHIEDIILIKMDHKGTMEWIKEIGNIPNYRFSANSIVQANDYGFIMTGYSMLDTGWDDYSNIMRLVVIKTDSLGNVEGYTSINDNDTNIPSDFTLYQNYPNPFNPTTTLQYGLPEATDVNLMIFDITGRKIKEWSIGNQQPGWHEVVWNGTNQSGQQVSTGVYIYSLRAGNFVDTKKMVFMK